MCTGSKEMLLHLIYIKKKEDLELWKIAWEEVKLEELKASGK